MSEKQNTTDDTPDERILSVRKDDHASENFRLPVQRLANQILEECLKQDWNRACILADELIHHCFGRGYFALARTIKKLRLALEPEVDEYKTRKYLLRLMWLLARAKREKNHFYLIYNDKKTCLLKKHESQKQQCDHDILFMEIHSRETIQENSFSTIAQRLSTEAAITYVETGIDAHIKLQPPHVKFSAVNQEIASQHQHIEVPKPMNERIHKKSSAFDPQTDS